LVHVIYLIFYILELKFLYLLSFSSCVVCHWLLFLCLGRLTVHCRGSTGLNLGALKLNLGPKQGLGPFTRLGLIWFVWFCVGPKWGLSHLLDFRSFDWSAFVW
jgi:hypothetical protein